MKHHKYKKRMKKGRAARKRERMGDKSRVFTES